jgi:hypothetical protein
MPTRRFCPLAAMLLMPACGTEPQLPPQDERPVRRPPEPACERARSTLDRQSRDGSLLYEDSGAAMVERGDWLRMDEGSRDRLIERLAVVAGCAAATPLREVEIVIRAENGAVLQRRRVEPSTDFRTGPAAE